MEHIILPKRRATVSIPPYSCSPACSISFLMPSSLPVHSQQTIPSLEHLFPQDVVTWDKKGFHLKVISQLPAIAALSCTSPSPPPPKKLGPTFITNKPLLSQQMEQTCRSYLYTLIYFYTSQSITCH